MDKMKKFILTIFILFLYTNVFGFQLIAQNAASTPEIAFDAASGDAVSCYIASLFH